MHDESCPTCGTRRVGAFRFCRSCGYDFEANAAPSGSGPRVHLTAPQLRLPGVRVQHLPIERILVALIALTVVGGVLALVGSPSPAAVPTPSAPASLAAVASPSRATSPSAPAASSAPTGPRLIGVSLPPRWLKVALTEAGLREQITSLQASNPKLAAILQGVLASGAWKVMTYYAVGFDGDAQIGTVVGSVIPTGTSDLDAIAPTIEAMFRQLGAADIAWRHLPLAAGDALVADFSLPVYLPAASAVVMRDRVFHVVVDGLIYQLTFTCYPGNTAACLSDADAIAQSLTLTPEGRGGTPL